MSPSPREHPFTFESRAIDANQAETAGFGKNVLLWARALQIQKERVFAAVDPFAALEGRHDAVALVIDSHLYVVALRNLILACKAANRHLRNLGHVEAANRASALVKAFERAFPATLALRNLREHWDLVLEGRYSAQRRGEIGPKPLTWHSIGVTVDPDVPVEYTATIAGQSIPVAASYIAAQPMIDGVLEALQETVGGGSVADAKGRASDS